jgi:hypothetical protein
MEYNVLSVERKKFWGGKKQFLLSASLCAFKSHMAKPPLCRVLLETTRQRTSLSCAFNRCTTNSNSRCLPSPLTPVACGGGVRIKNYPFLVCQIKTHIQLIL